MTTDNKIKNNLEFLDRISGALINSSPNYSLPLPDIYKGMTGRSLDKELQKESKEYFFSLMYNDKKPFETHISNTLQAEYAKLIEALYYLKFEGYINLDFELNTKITYKGILKYSRSFVAEHNRNESERLLSKMQIYITLITGILGLIIGLLI